MTTAGVLFTVTTTWNITNEKPDKEDRLVRNTRNMVAEAAKELRETPATKEQALRIMRDWIEQNNDIRNVRQDGSFILRFLRHKKYSIPMAQQTLLKYLNLRKYYPAIFTNLDYEDPKLENIINNGYIMVSPVRDGKGRRVIVYNISKFNASIYNCWDMCRAHVLVYETLMEDPEDQVCGFTHVGDGTGVTGGHIATWNPSDFARLIKWGEQSIPMRHKEFHLINLPSAVKYIIDFAASRVTPKMAQRLHIHSNLNQLHAKIDRACLPTVYGGELQLQDMVKHTKELLSGQKKKLLGLDEMELHSTRGIITSKRPNNTTVNGVVESVEGSFRKLEID